MLDGLALRIKYARLEADEDFRFHMSGTAPEQFLFLLAIVGHNIASCVADSILSRPAPLVFGIKFSKLEESGELE